MGQVPSESCYAAEPYIVTLETGRSSERLAAVTLSTETVGSIASPLFQHFYAARCDDTVRHWYCSSAARGAINDAPTPESVYRAFIEQPSRYASTQPQANDYTPMPIVLLKLHEDHWAKTNPTTEDLMNAIGCDVVGYFGCRHFNPDGSADNYGVIGMFLTKAFHNEAKSVAILEIAAKCYAESCSRAGCRQTVWPSEIHFGTLDTNLPCLRLVQKLLAAAGETFRSVWGDKISCVHNKTEGRFNCVIRGGAIASFAEDLASHVDSSNVLKAKSVDPIPKTVVHPILDATVQYAKAKWLESNRAVHDAHHQRELERKEKAREAAGATPAPSTSETSSQASGSTSKRSSTSSVTVHNPYASLDQKTVASIRPIGEESDSSEPRTPVEASPSPSGPSTTESATPEFVYLPKRTPIYFWKKGQWLHVQWRSEERSLRLVPVQSALEQGLLCVEACYDNAMDIAIFDEWHRPARLRLEHPTFYVSTHSVYTMDPATKAYSPLTYADPATIQMQPEQNVYVQH